MKWNGLFSSGSLVAHVECRSVFSMVTLHPSLLSVATLQHDLGFVKVSAPDCHQSQLLIVHQRPVFYNTQWPELNVPMSLSDLGPPYNSSDCLHGFFKFNKAGMSSKTGQRHYQLD